VDKHSARKTACSSGPLACNKGPGENYRAFFAADKASLAATVYRVCTSHVVSNCSSSAGMIPCQKADGIDSVVALRCKCSETADRSCEEDMKEWHGNYYRLNDRKALGTDLLVDRMSCKKADMCLSSVRQSGTTSLASSAFYTHKY